MYAKSNAPKWGTLEVCHPSGRTVENSPNESARKAN